MLSRPRWERCAEVIAGGVDYWTEATEGKSSDEILGLLLAEMHDSNSPAVDYFDGLVRASSSRSSSIK